jgi:hypothetical protein
MDTKVISRSVCDGAAFQVNRHFVSASGECYLGQNTKVVRKPFLRLI